MAWDFRLAFSQCPPDKPRLLAGDGAEATLRALLATLLQACAKRAVAAAASLDRFTRKGVAFAVGGNIGDTEVDAENAFGFDGGRFGLTDRDGKRELAVLIKQIDLSKAWFACEVSALVGAAIQSYLGSAVHGCQAGIGDPFETEHALVIDDSRVGSENVTDGFVRTVGFQHLANGTNGQLRGQAELVPARVIAGGVKRNLPEGFLCKGDFADPVAGGVELAEHLKKCNSLLAAG